MLDHRVTFYINQKLLPTEISTASNVLVPIASLQEVGCPNPTWKCHNTKKKASPSDSSYLSYECAWTKRIMVQTTHTNCLTYRDTSLSLNFSARELCMSLVGLITYTGQTSLEAAQKHGEGFRCRVGHLYAGLPMRAECLSSDCSQQRSSCGSAA